MKKLIFLMLMLAAGLSVSAQTLTAKQVIQKTAAAMDIKKNIKGYVITKVLGKEVSVYFATDGVNYYMSAGDGAAISYNNGGVQYTFAKKKNTVTIENKKYVNPFDICLDEFDEEDYDKATLTMANGEYTIKMKEGLASATIVVDSKTFFAKSLKFKVVGVSTNIRFKDLGYFTDRESLVYNASKFPGATIIDKRKKKK